MIRKLLLSALILSLLAACTVSESSAQLRYNRQILDWEYIAPEGDTCYYKIEYSFIQLTDSTRKAATDSINQFIDSYWAHRNDNRDNLTGMLELFQRDIRIMERLARDGYCMKLGNNNMYKVEPEFESSELFSLSLYNEGYTGGAHPHHHLRFVTFELASGHKLTLSDLFKGDYIAFLDTASYKAIESIYAGPERNRPNGMASFDIREHQLGTNDNFMLMADSIKFCFNEYEIAPYVIGGIVFSLPYESLIPIIDPEGALADLMASRQEKIDLDQ